ncbi:MAG: cysteine desulfurase family protein [Planctomycetaceae bacterium]
MIRSKALYLDNNATTHPLPEVLETVDRVWREAFANPGSRHAAGRGARQVLEESRETVARILDAEPDEVVFTSGGTESINLALFGLARGTGTIATGPGEHPATAESVATLVQRGWSHQQLAVDADGRLIEPCEPPGSSRRPDPADLKLVSMLLAHNETGVIQDVSPLVDRCNAAGVPTHLDCVQAVGKIPVSFKTLGATALSFGAHKFHGPRGVGGLLVRRGVRLVSLHHGGHQETDRRPGTEPVALIAGMAKALELWERDAADRTRTMLAARDRLEAALAERCPPVVVHGSQATRLPNTASVAFPGVNGDELLVALDLEGVACSLGSTCASGSSEPAPILLAMGVASEVALSTVRLSVSFETTEGEIDDAVARIARVVRRLRGE